MADTPSATVANAYVQVIPSAKGIKQGVTDVIANEGTAAGTGFGSKFAAGLKGVASTIAKVVTVAGTAAVAAGAAITKQAVDAYADYEQLTGGIETLYGEATSTVLANAQAAFKTAGLSANDYMETVMQFSGSLLQSVGGDTVRAAQMADMALQDMSDNANKMGVDMERLQDAYRGFARGNYTMLDNLSLGYGGTRSEMERLLKDAEAISGVHYDVENYADVVAAIHVIQDEMGITGTTAEEAASTISGSWGMLEASWSNLLVSIAGGGEDLDVAIEQTFESLMTWLGNLLPRVGEAVQGIIRAIPTVIETAWPVVKDTIIGLIAETFGEDAAESALSALDTIRGILERLGEKFGEFKAAITDNVLPAFANLAEAAQPLIDSIFPFIASVVEKAGMAFITVGTIIANFVASAINVIAQLLPVVMEKFNAIKEAISGPINNAKKAVTDAFDAIKRAFNTKLEFPKFKLPHFKIDGGEAPWGIGGAGKKPSFNVEWYATGGILSGAQLIGVGERGAEMVWPSYEPYLTKYASAIADSMPGDGALVGEVRALRDDVRNLKVYLDTGALVGGISRQMDGSLGRRTQYAGRGVV